jgi:hypothetical protein
MKHQLRAASIVADKLKIPRAHGRTSNPPNRANPL